MATTKPATKLAEWLTTAEAAARLSLSAAHVLRLVKDGTLEGQRMGRDWLVRRASLARYRRGKPGPKPQKEKT